MRLIILGAGGHGQVIADVAEQLDKYTTISFLDDNSCEAIGVCSDYKKYINANTEFYVAFGNNVSRLNWIEELTSNNAQLATIIHPTAYVSSKARVGKGCSVLPYAIINTDVIIGRGCIINIGSIIDHRVVLDDCVHIAPGAIVKAENHIEKYAKIESGEVVEARSR